MILKKLKRAHLSKTKAAMIGGLVDYVLAQKDEAGNRKVLYAYGMNFLTATTAAWKHEMIALAEESVRSKMPVAHWTMSWQENEVPSRQQVAEAVNIFLERMGLKEHQAIVAAHDNTANFHIHIVVNRTHPYTEKVIQPHRGFDIEAAHKIVAEIEHKQGWASQARARYRVDETGGIVRNFWREQVKPKPGAEDFEEATGEKSAHRIAQERGHAIIRSARSWRELHARLASVGLRFERKGSGAVIFVGETAVKASSVDRKFGLSKLCKKLGAFEAGEYPAEAPKIKPEPVSRVCREEWREYQKERRERDVQRRMARQRDTEAMARLAARQRQRRESACAALARHGLSVLNIARHCLKVQEREETAQTRASLPPRAAAPIPGFKRWLDQRHPRHALLWKFRRRITPGMEVKEFAFPKTGTLSAPFAAYQEMVKGRFPERLAQSRLDAMTALYLRCAGYRAKDVDSELERHAPAPADERERRENIRRRRRLLAYAFGTAGDIDIAAIQPTPEQIQKFDSEAERMERERTSLSERSKKEQERPAFRLH